MHLATVIGQLWSTRKEATLEGLRLVVVRPYSTGEGESRDTMVVVDPLGVGPGERVVVVHGRAARHVIGRSHDIGMQTAIAAIVDAGEFEDGSRLGSVPELDRPGTDPAARGAKPPSKKSTAPKNKN